MRSFYTAGGFNEQSSLLTFWIKNESSTTAALPLHKMFFDAADSELGVGGVPTNKLEVRWGTAGDWTTGVSLLADEEVKKRTDQNTYGGHEVDLSSLPVLGAGEQFALMIRATHIPSTGGYNQALTVWIDNVGITAIPEPGSFLGLGFVLASGLMFRNRRK
jgi:hypothetical protein